MSRWSKGFALTVVALCAVVVVLWTGAWVQAVPTGDYETTTVTAVDDNGTRLATVEARVADTRSKRIVGLSRTDRLAPDEGMVFVFDETANHSFVMRGMSFPLDIVFVDTNGTVTAIHHAGVPDSGPLGARLEEYRGRGKYVLEVNRGWANRTGLDVGDRIRVPNESAGGVAPTPTPDRPTVTAVDDNGSRLATVAVTIADDGSERYTGLSNTSSLAPNEGMLFVYEAEGDHTFVMRRMDFPLDIVFIDANGTVTRIHHAPVPPEGTSGDELQPYPGRGKYVLEVNRGWTNRTGLDVGDSVRVDVRGTY